MTKVLKWELEMCIVYQCMHPLGCIVNWDFNTTYSAQSLTLCLSFSLSFFFKDENKLHESKKQVFTHLTNKSISRDFLLHNKQRRKRKKKRWRKKCRKLWFTNVRHFHWKRNFFYLLHHLFLCGDDVVYVFHYNVVAFLFVFI